MILLANPPGTDNYLANGSTPILAPQKPIIVINSNFDLPKREIITEGTDIHGFILSNCKINVNGLVVRNTKCGGNLCDRQSINIGRCACYQMDNRSGNVIIQVDITINCEDGNSINTKFSSKWFLENYIFTGPLPVGTKAKSFDSYQVEDNLYDSLTNVIKYINDRCNFRVIGWVKRGEIQDQGVDQPSDGLPHNAARVLVQSGTLNYHITRIDPMIPHSIEMGCLENLKFDVKTAFNENKDNNDSVIENTNNTHVENDTDMNDNNDNDNCDVGSYMDEEL